jgi:hypothetical protein
LEARAGIGQLASRLQAKNDGFSEVTKQNRFYSITADFNSVGVRFGVRLAPMNLRQGVQRRGK